MCDVSMLPLSFSFLWIFSMFVLHMVFPIVKNTSTSCNIASMTSVLHH
ncbi:putative aspartyl aminopeptidase [Iris pallida]|uniref:Aspartyl aminopeptidase n=1 Tax=Iris pallida TaxID=29817 RepID=A0AAX6GTF2_IRIPA|nr:putative aspartyl aminopeptidase [Iris pallida]